MFAPDRIATRGRTATLAALSALALLFAGAAVGDNRVLAEAGSGKTPGAPRGAEPCSTNKALTTSTAMGRYSKERIRVLNLLLAVPLNLDLLKAEVSTLRILESRFNRRYGPDSVASRSVRDRLELLWEAWKSRRQSSDR